MRRWLGLAALVLLAVCLVGALAGCERRKVALPQEPPGTPATGAIVPPIAPPVVETPVGEAPVAAPPAAAPAEAPPPVTRPPPAPLPKSRFSRKYDEPIERAAKRWLPAVPWRLWKAQLYQESRLDPNARSPVGAEGIAQFMPYTWAEISRQMGLGAVPATSAAHAIDAGAFYMANLRAGWKAPRPEADRHNLAMASYNAGMGNILRSQKACGDPPGYEAIMACLHMVTGQHAAETRGYAPSIRRWHQLMEAEP